MENLITISNVKDNTLEFEVEITGINADNLKVCFVIEVDAMNISFDAKHVKKNKWTVNINAVTMLKATMYQFHIDVVADGYYFKPMEGSVNVVGTHDIYATKPKNITLEPHKNKEKTIGVLNKKSEVSVDKKTKPVVPTQINKKTEIGAVNAKDSSKLFKTIVGPDGSIGNKSTKKPITIKEEKLKDLLEDVGINETVTPVGEKPAAVQKKKIFKPEDVVGPKELTKKPITINEEKLKDLLKDVVINEKVKSPIHDKPTVFQKKKIVKTEDVVVETKEPTKKSINIKEEKLKDLLKDVGVDETVTPVNDNPTAFQKKKIVIH